ncbi:glycoside hydrolase family 36 protein [Haloarcula litorea]|uniref:glycoside hydrolase family 36 protein n=1 Tax=Haloarcula litorea TaxID=3032579 RepID=UPI0023E8A6F1|nr:glycoside hydrolase family 36 protein [Halomicroarcula sp. GDY20]
MVTVTAGGTTVQFDPGSVRLSIAETDAPDDDALLSGRVTATLGDRSFPVPDAGWTVERDGSGATISYDDDAATRLVLTAADEAVGIRLHLRNDTGDPAALERLCPLDADGVAFDADARIYRHGYQSWTPTGALPVDETFPAEPPENVPMMTDLSAPDRTSHGLVGLADGDRALTLGFLDHGSYVARFDDAVGDDGIERLTAVCPGDGVTVESGESAAAATLRVDASRPVDAGVAALADGVAERMGARAGEWTPTGWCSWYHYFTDVTADDMREAVADVAAWDPPIDVVQLDDGYQVAFGDWRTLAEGFDEMPALTDDIEGAGYTPGLWLAPFFVQADAALVDDHPEWFVTDADGAFVSAGERHGEMYGLDCTHPGVEAWLTDTFETIVDDWGFDYLKLDFLYAGALPGQRHDDVTRAEAYQRGLKTIRQAVGRDTFLLGCGAPQAQSVGLVDAMRVGPDTAPHWRDPDGIASEPAHENALRNVLNRQFAHDRWWVNDPDCQLLRPGTDLTDAERRTLAAVVALTGGSNVLSDRVAAIDEPGRTLFERSLPPVDGGTVEGVGDRTFPERVECERPADGGRAVALVNWADEPRTRSLSLAADERGWDAWDGEPIPAGGTAEREVPTHGCLLAHVAPARARPHLLGTAHLAGLGDRVERVAWDDDADELTVAVDAERPQEVVVALPDGWTHADADGAVETLRTTVDGTATVAFDRA